MYEMHKWTNARTNEKGKKEWTNWTALNRTEPNRTEPNRTEPNRTEPNQNEAKRNETKSNACMHGWMNERMHEWTNERINQRCLGLAACFCHKAGRRRRMTTRKSRCRSWIWTLSEQKAGDRAYKIHPGLWDGFGGFWGFQSLIVVLDQHFSAPSTRSSYLLSSHQAL